MTDDRLNNCIFLKTILMILVMIGHAVAFWSGEWFTRNPAISSVGLDVVYRWLQSFHIYAFTLISGYVFAYKINRGGYKSYLLFIKK